MVILIVCVFLLLNFSYSGNVVTFIYLFTEFEPCHSEASHVLLVFRLKGACSVLEDNRDQSRLYSGQFDTTFRHALPTPQSPCKELHDR